MVRSAKGARALGALLGLLLLLITAPVRAQAVALVSSSFNSGSLQASWSHTVPAGGQNRYLLVGVSLRHVQRATVVSEARFVDATNVTQPLALLGSTTLPGQVRIELWGLAAPGEGQGVITVRLDATGGLVAGGLSFTGVHQVASVGALVSNMGTGATASLAVPSATGEAIVSVFANNGIVLPVPRAPHTSQWAFQGQLVGAGGHEAGRIGATVVWDAPGASLPWLLTGVSVKPAQPVALPPDAGPPDLPPDLPPDSAVLPPDASPPDAPPPVDASPMGVDSAPPAPDSSPGGTDAPIASDLPPGPADGSPGAGDGPPAAVDGSPLADAAPDGAAAADARADGGSDGAVSIYQGTYDIGCACRLERPPTGTGGSPLAALAAITLLALIARRRGR